MLVEVFVAALAVYVWVNAEPGLVRALAFDAMLIGGVATLGFNLNPLLRFDGYYVLADWIEIPNLRQRASRYVGWLFERFAMRRPDAGRPQARGAEAAWLVGYAVASFAYRVVVVVAIFLFVLEKSLVVGVALILLASIGWIALPLARALRTLFADPRLEPSRPRALAVLLGGLAAALLLLGVVPLPHRTQVEGIVWIPEEALVRAGVDGFVAEVLAEPGQQLHRGDPIASCRAPGRTAELHVLEARLRALDARYHHEQVADRVRAAMIDEERDHVRERLARVREQLGELVIRARADGVFVAPSMQDLPGRFVHQGQPIAHVLPADGVTIRAVVSEDDIDLVRDPGTRARVRLAERRAEVVPAELRRIVPAASAELPSSALGRFGGGRITVDPRDERGTRALEKLFVVDLALPDGPLEAGLGGRAHVRFEHAPRPLLAQWYRGLRQLFLERLDV
jgi:putative peptide zinc metalloprotease protein